MFIRRLEVNSYSRSQIQYLRKVNCVGLKVNSQPKNTKSTLRSQSQPSEVISQQSISEAKVYLEVKVNPILANLLLHRLPKGVSTQLLCRISFLLVVLLIVLSHHTLFS